MLNIDPVLRLEEAELLAALPPEAAGQVRAQLESEEKACGCQEGAAFGFLALTAFAILALSLGWGPAWLAVIGGIAAFFGAVGIGKYYGLARATRRREALIVALREHVAERAAAPVA
jgi:hypothetical protein